MVTNKLLMAFARKGAIDKILAVMTTDDESEDNADLAYKWLQVSADFGHKKAAKAADDLLESSSLRYDDGGGVQGLIHFELGRAYLLGEDGLRVNLAKARSHLEFARTLDIASTVDLAQELKRLRKRLGKTQGNALLEAIFFEKQPAPGRDKASSESAIARSTVSTAGPRMKPVDWKPFEYFKRTGGPVVPSLSAFFYLAADVRRAATALADGLERYIQFVGFESLASYASRSGDYKAITQRTLDSDLKHLRAFPKSHIALTLEYDSGKGGAPGGFGVYINGDDDENSASEKATSFLRVDFPASWLENHDVEALVQFFAEMTQLPHVQSANMGFTFKSTSGSEQHGNAQRDARAKLGRYLAFHPCDRHVSDHMLGCTFSPHWLNYVDDKLAAKLGGYAAITKALERCDIRNLEKGVLIRGAKFPPIGDLQKQAPDLGCLPEVARVLAPTRFDPEDSSFSLEEDFDAAAWLARLDKFEARPWDNSKA